MSLAGKAAIVTGSSRGIGAAIALALARSGADVVLNHRTAGGSSAAKAAAVAEAIRALGRRAVVVPADIALRRSAAALVAAAAEQFGRLDLLVLSAARAPFKPIERLLERELRALVETNFLGNLFCLHEAVPALSRTRGSVVFVSSLGSRVATPSYPLGSLKAAMEVVVRDCAASLEPRGVNLNAVCGGLVRTDATKAMKLVWEGLDRIPESAWVAPEEIAEVVLFLCSPAARAIRGQTIVVDRGLSSRLLP